MRQKEEINQFIRHILNTCDGSQLDGSQFAQEDGQLIEELNNTSRYIREVWLFASEIANGNLDSEAPPRSNMLSGSLRALRSNLLHLTWQAQQIAEGDYHQKVDFMGEFSESFNRMIAQLDSREQRLREIASQDAKRAEEMKANNDLMVYITDQLRDLIVVQNAQTSEVLFLNLAVKQYRQRDQESFKKITEQLYHRMPKEEQREWDFYLDDEQATCFQVNSFSVQWKNIPAVLHVLKDVTLQRKELQKIESLVYEDPMTKLYNRRYCLKKMEELLTQKRAFSLCFIDLNFLKIVNDRYGHEAGDEYLLTVSKVLKSKKREKDSVCRVGGDELVALFLDCGKDVAEARMREVQEIVQKIGEQKDWPLSISYGITEIDEQNEMLPHEIIQNADAKMYQFKMSFKKKLKN